MCKAQRVPATTHRFLQINYKHAPRDGQAWSKDYHNKLYNLTDQAIRGAPFNGRAAELNDA